MIAKQENYDPAHNAYIVANSLREETRGNAEHREDPFNEIKKLVWNSDAVIIGTPTLRVSSLTASHQFVFSEYEVKLDTVLYDPNHQLSENAHIVVTRAGGDVKVGNQTFRAIETEFPLFRLGTSYIFFLHYNRESGSFAVTSSGSFLVLGEQIFAGRAHPRFVIHPVDRLGFINQIRVGVESDRRGSR